MGHNSEHHKHGTLRLEAAPFARPQRTERLLNADPPARSSRNANKRSSSSYSPQSVVCSLQVERRRQLPARQTEPTSFIDACACRCMCVFVCVFVCAASMGPTVIASCPLWIEARNADKRSLGFGRISAAAAAACLLANAHAQSEQHPRIKREDSRLSRAHKSSGWIVSCCCWSESKAIKAIYEH